MKLTTRTPKIALAALLLSGATATTVALSGSALAKGKPTPAATAESSIVLNEAGTVLSLGDPVTFTTNAVGLGGSEYPMVVVKCSGYGTTDVLYAQLDHPDAVFILGGGTSAWWLVGGDADCEASLLAYGGKSKGFDTIRLLAGPITFDAEG